MLKPDKAERAEKARAQAAIEYMITVAAVIGFITLIAYILKEKVLK